MDAIYVVTTMGNVAFGLAVACSAAFVYGRSKAAAGFIATAGLAAALAAFLHFALGNAFGRSHLLTHGFIALISTAISAGRNLVFYGGLIFGIRALALAHAREPRAPR